MQILFLIVFISGCAPEIKNRPADFPNTKWVCNKPDIWFEVDKDHQSYGEIKINGITKPFKLGFGQAHDVHFYSYDENNILTNILFNGLGTFSKDKMVVEIRDDNVFNDKYKTITFYRKRK